MQLTKKRENKAKLELAGRNEKLDWAEKEVEEVKNQIVLLILQKFIKFYFI